MAGSDDGQGRGGCVTEQVGIDCRTPLGLGAGADAVVEGHLGHGRPVLGDPQGAVGGLRPPPRPRFKDRPPDLQIGLQRRQEGFGQRDLVNRVSLGVVLGEGDEPARGLAQQGATEDEVGEIAPPDRVEGEKGDDQPVAVGDGMSVARGVRR